LRAVEHIHTVDHPAALALLLDRAWCNAVIPLGLSAACGSARIEE
jgi:hypothetical protein